tara:strand:+ start:84 stop:470 length:387 start_codon:yes stop_codon:yes gene_type:complete
MAEIVIKLDDSFNIQKVNNHICQIFQENNQVIFIFDIVSVNILNWKLLLSVLPILKKFNTQIKKQLIKSIIIAPQKWQHLLLQAFFLIYKPIKPFQMVFSYDQIEKNNNSNLQDNNLKYEVEHQIGLI